MEELVDMAAQEVLDMVGCLPEEDLHCTTLAAGTVKEAGEQYMKNG